MATPQERRFAWLAQARKLLTAEQIQQCVSFQEAKRKQGSTLPLWDCAVLQNMLKQGQAERLQSEAGDLGLAKLGAFKLIRKLGEGAMGSVYLGVGPGKERAAIKVLSDHLARQRTFLTRFFREGQAAIRLQHPNIVRGIDLGEEQGHYYYAMEFVRGRTVRQVMQDTDAVFPPARATEIVRQVAEGLAYAHEHGIIHRDIKPDNIMVTGGGVAKLADLGLARQTDGDLTALTRTGTSMGTPFYMAPEQAMDAKRADARSDIYSLGATWYHMLTGRAPFEGETSLEIFQKHLKQPLRAPQTINPAVPKGVSLTIERMMAKQPDNRVQTARELVELIDSQCVGDRDVEEELGLGRKRARESMWDVKVPVRGRLEKRRFSLSEFRKLARKGVVTRDTPARPAGRHEQYQPASAFTELARELPRDYSVHVHTADTQPTPTSRSKLHDLVSHFDAEKKAYRRRKKLKRALPHVLSLAIFAAVALAVWHWWPQISSFVGGLLGRAAAQ